VLCVIYWTCVFQVEDWNRSWEGCPIEEYGREMHADSSLVSIVSLGVLACSLCWKIWLLMMKLLEVDCIG